MMGKPVDQFARNVIVRIKDPGLFFTTGIALGVKIAKQRILRYSKSTLLVKKTSQF